MGVLVEKKIDELQQKRAAKSKIKAKLDQLFMSIHKSNEHLLTFEFLQKVDDIIIGLKDKFDKIRK